MIGEYPFRSWQSAWPSTRADSAAIGVAWQSAPGLEGWGFLRLAKARKVQLKAWMKPVVRVAICAFPGLPGCAGGVYRL